MKDVNKYYTMLNSTLKRIQYLEVKHAKFISIQINMLFVFRLHQEHCFWYYVESNKPKRVQRNFYKAIK